jgi:catechol 2,3-dioxygenase-like lactoylglutathione lyase family enzyme
MSAIPGNVSAITLFVSDIDASKTWYGTLLEGDAIFQDDVSAAFRLDHVIVNLLAVTDAPELVEPAAVATPVTVSALLTITVEDCDAACAALAAKGVEILNGPIDRPWGVRTAAFQDPDGHAWELAQPIPQAAESAG